MQNITIYDNGSGYAIMVDGLIIKVESSLGNAWRHIKWMYEVASQQFTVGKNKIPVKEWIDGATKLGFLD